MAVGTIALKSASTPISVDSSGGRRETQCWPPGALDTDQTDNLSDTSVLHLMFRTSVGLKITYGCLS